MHVALIICASKVETYTLVGPVINESEKGEFTFIPIYKATSIQGAEKSLASWCDGSIIKKMKFLTISKCWTGLECGWDWSGDLAKTKRLSMQTEGLVVMPHPLGPGTPTPDSPLGPQECHHRSTHVFFVHFVFTHAHSERTSRSVTHCSRLNTLNIRVSFEMGFSKTSCNLLVWVLLSIILSLGPWCLFLASGHTAGVVGHSQSQVGCVMTISSSTLG